MKLTLGVPFCGLLALTARPWLFSYQLGADIGVGAKPVRSASMLDGRTRRALNKKSSFGKDHNYRIHADQIENGGRFPSIERNSRNDGLIQAARQKYGAADIVTKKPYQDFGSRRFPGHDPRMELAVVICKTAMRSKCREGNKTIT